MADGWRRLAGRAGHAPGRGGSGGSASARRRRLPPAAMALGAVVALAAATVGAGPALRAAVWGPAAPGSARLVRVVVRPGMSAAAVARELAAAGVVRSALAFRLEARLGGEASRLEAGTYLLGPGMTTARILHVLATGQVAVVRVTVPEGWTAAQVAALLAARGIGTPAEALAAVRDPRALAAAGLPPPPPDVRDALEGYLFPATYPVPRGATPRVAVQAMLRRFRQAWTPALAAAARRNAGLDTAQAVTLASIVQSEVRRPGDMAVVAGVYLNRLRRGMDLDADPTVLYGLGLLGVQRTALTAAETRTPSPYNTYLRRGLPPGPICSPGAQALEAVAHPARVRALYFLTAPDGRVVLADTLAAQEAHVREYLGG